MREIFKYGSVRGVMSSHVYKLNKYKEASMPTLQHCERSISNTTDIKA